ncbi:MAG: MFS transporter [Deltaproteobacteria bacterium]|nr:MFS transporter [Deltaproteobacteria bacterium]
MTVTTTKIPDPQSKDVFNAGKVLTLSICHFIHDIYSSFLAPLLPLLVEKFSMTLTQAGFLSTIMQIPALFNPFIGLLADRITVRYFIILAPATTAIPMSLLGLAPSYGVLSLLLFVTGVSVAVFHVPAPVMVSQVSGSKTGKGMSFYMAGGELARTIGPMVAVGSVSILGFQGYYPIMIFGILASLWLYFNFHGIDVQVKKSDRKPLLSTCREMKHILLPLTAILVTRGFMHASTTTFLPTLIKLETGNIWLAGFGLTAFEAFGVGGVLSSGILSDYFGRRQILIISLICAPISLFLFVYTGGLLRCFMLLITGFTLLSTTPVMLAIVQENAKSSPSTANGLFMMVSFISRSAIVVIVGIIADHVGLPLTYCISAAIGLISIPFILMLPKNKAIL